MWTSPGLSQFRSQILPIRVPPPPILDAARALGLFDPRGSILSSNASSIRFNECVGDLSAVEECFLHQSMVSESTAARVNCCGYLAARLVGSLRRHWPREEPVAIPPLTTKPALKSLDWSCGSESTSGVPKSDQIPECFKRLENSNSHRDELGLGLDARRGAPPPRSSDHHFRVNDQIKTGPSFTPQSADDSPNQR